ncbi:GntR family transcriptional regulator [Bradyrhizobium sp. NP1]|uniref:GntR family transcriptional regulator n=1 Tax=Bradyrhizobium sp. NP1 TaxID=3049772 RepID=UPI0025A4E3C4|nr:GntR family transcriptional regulator [Bradyrhizobium sp. NP1]WJR76756.1 GntR family transcriptional regulator [Bradyrhizobium sp. NP1]
MVKKAIPQDRRDAVVSLSEEAVIRIRELIVSGEMPPGTHLQEIPLAERLGISRTPVRSALNTLAQEGLLVPGPKRGYKTRSFSIEELIDAYAVRATLEALACGILAQRGADDVTRDVLQECLDCGDRALAQGHFAQKDQESWVDMNERLHSTIYKATGNEMLISFVEVAQRLPLTSSRNVHWYRFDDRNYFLAKQAHSHHHVIVSAILERNSGRAEAAMREHIRFSSDLLSEYYQQMVASSKDAAAAAAEFATKPHLLIA